MPYIFSSTIVTGWVYSLHTKTIDMPTEATEAILEPLIVTQLIAVFLGIARSGAWVGFWCGVFNNVCLWCV